MFTSHTLSIQNLSLQRGTTMLFRHVNLNICSGELLVVLGHNGVGKTSLLRTLVGLIDPYEGSVTWQREDEVIPPEAHGQNALYLGHQSGLHPQLTVCENLAFYRSLRNGLSNNALAESRKALNYFELEDYADRPCFQLSKGQAQRVMLTRLINEPVVSWILDEPAAVLDRHSIRLFEKLLAKHLHKGGLVLMTSHQSIQPPQVTVRNFHLASEAH
ncbi:MAG: cytochrome c biogenesis heme-transporting ATPase CcmA [Candidatus Oxydemutatoraceae bacterium WSBS_2016_MAG_OTU14]